MPGLSVQLLRFDRASQPENGEPIASSICDIVSLSAVAKSSVLDLLLAVSP